MKKPDRLIIDSARAVCVYNRRNGTHEAERETCLGIYEPGGATLAGQVRRVSEKSGPETGVRASV